MKSIGKSVNNVGKNNKKEFKIIGKSINSFENKISNVGNIQISKISIIKEMANKKFKEEA